MDIAERMKKTKPWEKWPIRVEEWKAQQIPKRMSAREGEVKWNKENSYYGNR